MDSNEERIANIKKRAETERTIKDRQEKRNKSASDKFFILKFSSVFVALLFTGYLVIDSGVFDDSHNTARKDRTETISFRGTSGEDRKEKIRSQFSSWDGSHLNLERFVKKRMHNPDSYEHVETTYGDRGNHLVVRTVFRGTNALGAVVTNSITAKVSHNAQILEVIE
ncbi:hypothetical protein DIT71_17275 [Marinobacter vulgaris]|uniref:Uncharacterized protein n=1 Tax=Marinobacter vulgaris TaxID=1928331 RepID=A0A2V3ZGM0_9GAMM|nr:hypothetical protein [Marinobacter vulgaris]PXX88759.1 hypothetical protein DIT71_17275 [Marinobacter vulgaris]TSJ66372.1 hypothetical protein FPC41_17200 [Marinobacter vulgaris]